MQHGLLARVDLVLVENATVEGLVRTCWDHDYATSSYVGYRAGR